MVTDTTQDRTIRRAVISEVNDMNVRLLQRIAYEVRCEELGLHVDGWKLYPED
jgi:hypothetical protein